MLSTILLTTVNGEKDPLYLLTLLPFSENDSALSCVDRGAELLPAAQLAALIANNNILSEFQLEIVSVTTSKCSEDSFSQTLANFVTELTSRSVIGVIGMMCSSAVLSVSPLASHNSIDILQITSGTVSPKSIDNAREIISTKRLYQTAPSSTDFNDQLIKLITENNVTRLAVITHIGTFFIEHDVISTDLHAKIDNTVNVTDYELQFDNTRVPVILDSIATSIDGIRMIYASVTANEARELLCNAVSSEREAKIIFPRNQWIFHSHSYEELSQPTSTCSAEEMRQALEGVVLLQHAIRTNDSDTLKYTNYTYSEYLERYRQDLNTTAPMCDKPPGIIHTNALFDSVIAFAEAINSSLQTLNKSQLLEYSIRNINPFVTDTLRDELDKVSFNGASGNVDFDSLTHAVIRPTNLSVIVISNGTEFIVSKLKIEGSFPRRENKIPMGLPIVVFALVLILVLVHTVTLILFVYYWSDPDIKATSPMLSLLIFAACYMLDVSLLLTALRYSFANDLEFRVFCGLENWLLFIGIQLIFATLLVRLFRIYRIFFHYSKLGKIWSDYSMLLAIVLLTSVVVIILILWTAIDTPKINNSVTFNSKTQSPYFSELRSCKSEYFDFFPIWIILLLIYIGFTMVFVLLLAIRTRKVKMESFKDTKTVNIFVYTTVVCFMFLMVISLLFEALREQVVVFVFRVLALSSVAIACTCFLFLPKINSAQCERKNPRRKSMTTQIEASTVFVTSNAYMTTSL